MDEEISLDQGKVMRHLRALLKNHGVTVTQRDDWLCHERGYSLSTSAHVANVHDDGVTLRLDVEVSLPDGRLLTESFAGLGGPPEDALKDAYANFIRSSLHVVLVAFLDDDPGEHVAMEEWDIEGTHWRAVMGPVTCRSTADSGAGFPDALGPSIEKAIRSSTLDHNTHWFRFFHGETAGETTQEWLADSLIAPETEGNFADLQWPKQDGYYSARTFWVLTRVEPADIAWLEGATALKVGVDLIVDSWAAQSLSDADVYRRLTNARIAPDLAERLIVFGRLGFSSTLLGAAAPAIYQAVDGARPGPETPLDSEPAFVAARERALASDRDTVLGVASGCSLANAAVQAGVALEDITPEAARDWTFAPPMVWLRRFRPPDAASVRRPWYRFW